MRERNQVGGAFRRLYRGDARDAEDVTFLRSARADQRQGLGLHDNPARGACDAARLGFPADVHHVRRTLAVEVTECHAENLTMMPGLCLGAAESPPEVNKRFRGVS